MQLLNLRGVKVKFLQRIACRCIEDETSIVLHNIDPRLRDEPIQCVIRELSKLIAKKNGLQQPTLSQPTSPDYSELIELIAKRRHEQQDVIQSDLEV